MMRQVTTGGAPFSEIEAARRGEFLDCGFAGRHFFAHRVYHLPKCGPDGYKLAKWMCGESDPAAMSELVLYADPELARSFPDDLWFDRDLIWHEQQFGRPGQVATANLRASGSDLYAMVLVSDLVQRISRRPADKSRVENRFKGWAGMLLNAALSVADGGGYRRLLVPRAGWALKHTDPNRDVGPALFERVYDQAPARYRPLADGEWWAIDVAANRDRLVAPVTRREPAPRVPPGSRTVCIVHDTERGLGHLDSDPDFVARAEAASERCLGAMARIEHSMGIRTTYSIVGSLMDRLAPGITALGHDVAFHSYDHVIGSDQLERCRGVDYRIKGYRPPQSRLTDELTDEALLFHNFEWMASSAHSLGIDSPVLHHGLVKIPVHLDDWPMYAKGESYGQWKAGALGRIRSAPFTVVGLHDCYAEWWIDDYENLLKEITAESRLVTLNEVAASVVFDHAIETRARGGRAGS
jgi:hypothetical protein